MPLASARGRSRAHLRLLRLEPSAPAPGFTDVGPATSAGCWPNGASALVYGGASVGLMGRVADAALARRRRGDRGDPRRPVRRRGGPRRADRAARRRLDARAQGPDVGAVRRLHRPARRLRHHRGGGRGGHVDPARHPRQAGRPARRRRLLSITCSPSSTGRWPTACSSPRAGPSCCDRDAERLVERLAGRSIPRPGRDGAPTP